MEQSGGSPTSGKVQVKAEPTEYSVTFDASDTVNTTVENPYGYGKYAICTTTARGNKLGVAGSAGNNELSFREANFRDLQLDDDTHALSDAGANDFDHITGYMISFSGGSLVFKKGSEFEGSSVTSGVKYNVSLTPDDNPRFARGKFVQGIVAISSLTIWYSC